VNVSKVSIAAVLAVSVFALAGCTGSVGATGTGGHMGATGATGPAGAAGKTGARGPAGSTGATGATGARGAKGASGSTDATGPKGATGARGATGPAGAIGPAGVPGPVGPFGPVGAQGPAGQNGANATSDYAYIYNVFPESVAIEDDITFSDIGLSTSAISHVPGSASINVNAAGVYAVWFSVTADQPNQFALMDNGVSVDGGTYGSGAGTQQNSGMVIVNALAGDTLTLRNHSSVSAVNLAFASGGINPAENASVLIEKLG
jgi:hypothetical protein